MDLSAFYADVSKDCLYTFAAGSPERRSAQTAMYVMADGLARLLAPILPVTADELWRHLPARRRARRACTSPLFPATSAAWSTRDVDTRWDALREIRDEVNRALETARQEKLIGTSLAAHVRDSAAATAASLLARYEAELPMLFIVSQVTLDTRDSEGRERVGRARGRREVRALLAHGPRCRAAGDLAGLCSRCVDALAAGGRSRDPSRRSSARRRWICHSGRR